MVPGLGMEIFRMAAVRTLHGKFKKEIDHVSSVEHRGKHVRFSVTAGCRSKIQIIA